MAPVEMDTFGKLSFLRDADPETVEALVAAATHRQFEAGEIILEQGSSGRELYLVVEGLVEVVKHHQGEEVPLATRGPGDFFGEMGLIEEKPRFATVRALEASRVLEISEPDLRAILAQRPGMLYQVTRMLSARLREADLHMIADLQRKNRQIARAYRELQEAQAGLLEKERLEHELDLARELQQSILPQTFPDIRGARFAAYSRPARQVGGDFYDFIPMNGERLGLVIADVSDKGLSAALYMAVTHSLIRAEARHYGSPRQVLLSTHKLLLEMTRTNMFVTVVYGVLDLAKGSLHYARAGHNHPLLFNPHTGACRALAGRGIVLGCVEHVDLEEVSIELHPGELLVLYTDGITDANSADGEFFGEERLHETVCATAELSAQNVCDLIFDRVDRFQAGAVQYDDMAVLAVRIE